VSSVVRRAILAGSLASGCLNPSTYSTPRTVPDGKVALTAALEAFDLRTRAPSVRPGNQRALAPLPPVIIVRVGLGERTDIGVGTWNLATVGLDLKHNFVRGEFDVAIDPTVQVQPFTIDRNHDDTMVAGHLPLLFGLNLSPEFSVVAAAGVTAVPVGPSNGDDILSLGAAGHDERFLGRGSLGLDFRVTQSMAIHPEVTMLRGFRYDTTLLLFGVGVTTGRLPSFDP
jgi:hypothetical protein